MYRFALIAVFYRNNTCHVAVNNRCSLLTRVNQLYIHVHVCSKRSYVHLLETFYLCCTGRLVIDPLRHLGAGAGAGAVRQAGSIHCQRRGQGTRHIQSPHTPRSQHKGPTAINTLLSSIAVLLCAIIIYYVWGFTAVLYCCWCLKCQVSYCTADAWAQSLYIATTTCRPVC